MLCCTSRREQAAEAMELHATAHAVVPGQLDRLLHMCAPSRTGHPLPCLPYTLTVAPLDPVRASAVAVIVFPTWLLLE